MDNSKKLYRSKDKRMIAGVAGGLGEYFDIDPVLIRIIFVLLAFASGFGILLYLILAIIVPLEPPSNHPLGPEKPKAKGEEVKEFTQKAEQKIKSLAKELDREANNISKKYTEKMN